MRSKLAANLNQASMVTFNPFAIPVPARFESAKWADVPADIKKHIDGIREHRKGLYVWGDVGTGKTHMVWGISKHFAEVGIKHKVINSTTLLADIKNDWDKRRQYAEYETTIDKLKDFRGVIIIDDIGAEKHSDWVAETFYTLINQRYEKMRPMIFTSNYSLDEMADRIGDRVCSRIVEMSKVVHISGNDRRLKK